MIKPSQLGFRPWENHTTALRASEMHPPFGGWRHMNKPLWGLRVLKSDGAIAPRVLKFDSGFAAEGCGGAYELIEGALL